MSASATQGGHKQSCNKPITLWQSS